MLQLYVIIERGDYVLAARRGPICVTSNGNSRRKGGADESKEDALLRELQEELAVTTEIIEALPVGGILC